MPKNYVFPMFVFAILATIGLVLFLRHQWSGH
jgi:hypothetical protein